MGTFAETAIINYCLSFADQGKQTYGFCFRSQQSEVCCFCFLFAENNGSCHFPFAKFRKRGDKDMETWKWRHRHRNMEHEEMETWRHQTENGKRKPGQFSLIHLPFAHHANITLSVLRLLMNKQTEVIRWQTD
jgi:hypothetical protein